MTSTLWWQGAIGGLVAMALAVQELISPELLAAARRIFGTVGGPIPVFLQQTAGDVRIGGGSAGPQTIKTLAIDSTIRAWMEAVFERLDTLLDLDFAFSPTSNGSKIHVYLDTEIDLGGGGTTLGVALSNEFRRSSWWEIILNGPPLLTKEDYFKFAFVHELGHVLGLEHPFDGSDGDLGGERFGDPDASVTAMSYTRPPGGWPDFYTAADLAALVSVWGLEEDTPAWLIRDASGTALQFERKEAESRLGQLLQGDVLLGPAPPPTLGLRPGSDPQQLILTALAERAVWEVSWDGGINWQTGSGNALVLADTRPRQVSLRQRDRWGQLSPEFVGVVSPSLVISVGPELLLPPLTESNPLVPLLIGPSGDPVLLWGMTTGLAADPSVSAGIRRAVADLDAVVALDLLELPVAAEDNTPVLPQLLFSTSPAIQATPGNGLIALTREQELIHHNDGLLRLNDQLKVTLEPEALTTPTALRRAVLQGLGHGLGLQTPPTGLLPSTSTMVPVDSAATAGNTAELSALDRSALINLHGVEANNANNSDLANLNTSPAILGFGDVSASFRSDRSGQEITILALPVKRSGNMEWSVPLEWRAGTLETTLLLEPGQRDGLLQLELPSGQQQELRLEARLPMQAIVEEGSNSVLEVNLHALEFGLTTSELLDNRWNHEANPWQRKPIPWNLAPDLESVWGNSLRTILQAVDDACGLTFTEVQADDPLLQWRFINSLSAERELQIGNTETNTRVFALSSDPSIVAARNIGSQEQIALQSILLALGLERPEQANDGDAYKRTPVFPEDSALFNAMNFDSSTQASLQRLDAMALAERYGQAASEQARANSAAPVLSLALVKEQSGVRLTRTGIERVLRLAINRSGDLTGDNQVLVTEDHLGLAEHILLETGQAQTELSIPLPSGAIETLDLNLEVLSGRHDPAASTLRLQNAPEELAALARQPARDPITNWRADLDGDGSLTAELEGRLLMRFAFGTFPGEQLTADLTWNRESHETNIQPDQWLSSGLESGLTPGGIGQIMQLLHNTASATYPNG